MTFLDQLGNAIARMEGWQASPGNRPTRNNNPGNLRAAPDRFPQLGKDDRGYVIFTSAEAGWAALRNQIELDTSRGLTVREFIYKYSPPSENDTASYLNFVTRELGVSPDAKLSALAAPASPVHIPGSTLTLPGSNLFSEYGLPEFQESIIPAAAILAGAVLFLWIFQE